MARRDASLATVIACAGLAIICFGVSSTEAQAHAAKSGSMTVKVLALPSHTKGHVIVAGRGEKWRLRRTARLHGLGAGTYRVVAKPVVTKTSTYYPTVTTCADLVRCPGRSKHHSKLKSSGHRTIFVVYETIVPKTTEVLSRAVVKRLHTFTPDGSITFDGGSRLPFTKGDVIVAAPSRWTPYGLLRRVLSVQRGGGAWKVRTSAATLAEEMPRGVLAFGPNDAGPRGMARASDVSGSVGIEGPHGLSCEAGPSATIDFGGSVAHSPLSTLFAASWGPDQGPTVRMNGWIAATMKESMKTGSDASCDWGGEWPSNPSPGLVIGPFQATLGPIPVWVSLEVVADYQGSVGMEGAASFSREDEFKLSAAVAYEEGSLKKSNLSATHSILTASATPAKSGKGELSVGAKVYIDPDELRLFSCKLTGKCLNDVPYLEASPKGTLQTSPFGPPSAETEPWWRLDGSIEGKVGLDFDLFGKASLHVARTYDIADFPIRAPVGRPLNVGAEPGDESAKVSWEPPPEHPGDETHPCACKSVDSYTVYLDGEEWATVGPRLTSLNINKLTNGQTYQVSVRANAAEGGLYDSLKTEPVSVTPHGGGEGEEGGGEGTPGHCGGDICVWTAPGRFGIEWDEPVSPGSWEYAASLVINGVPWGGCLEYYLPVCIPTRYTSIYTWEPVGEGRDRYEASDTEWGILPGETLCVYMAAEWENGEGTRFFSDPPLGPSNTVITE